jgi:hypothetical protein
LVAAGHDPGEAAEAYRGDTLCLHIRAIGEAAKLRVGTSGFAAHGTVQEAATCDETVAPLPT